MRCSHCPDPRHRDRSLASRRPPWTRSMTTAAKAPITPATPSTPPATPSSPAMAMAAVPKTPSSRARASAPDLPPAGSKGISCPWGRCSAPRRRAGSSPHPFLGTLPSAPRSSAPRLRAPPPPSQLGLDSLDLNANDAQAWGDMHAYQGILQSGDEDGVCGRNRAPPPVRVPRGGTGTTGQRAPRNGEGGGGRFPQRGAAPASARCSRGRAARRRLNHSADNVPDDKCDRAAWSEQNTLIFCRIYCEAMDMGLCNRGQMTKMGWEKITEDYYKETKLLHDNKTFGSKVRGLKTLWLDIQNLYTSATGLGQEANGDIIATDEWWAKASKGKKELLKLKDGMPEYLPELERMFLGVAVTREGSYVPGHSSKEPQHVSSDEAEDEDANLQTPVSNASKRSFSSLSTRSTATSPNKKLKSPAMRTMNNNMVNLNGLLEKRTKSNEIMWAERQKKDDERLQKVEERQQKEEAKVKDARARRQQVMQMAKDLGVTGQDKKRWIGVLKLVRSEVDMDVFEGADEDGRKEIIDYLAGEGEQPAPPVDTNAEWEQQEWEQQEREQQEWEQDFFAMLAEEDEEEMALIYGMYTQYAVHLSKYYNRADYRVPKQTGLEWVQEKLANETYCYNMFRMTTEMFYSLHDLLTTRYGLKDTPKSTSIEALGMFLWILGAPQSVRQVEDRFARSLGTVHAMFYRVLKSVLKLADSIIRPRDPEFSTPHARVMTQWFFPEFKDCIGAIDGSHIPCVVPADKLKQHMCRKGVTTQNVMAACDFDMIFTFVLAGWAGSVHDMRVFDCAMTRYKDDFPHPPEGKFYVVDSGYPNRPGYLSPYKGTMYHIQDFQNVAVPPGIKETFNYAHSSLRNVIERAFGILKMKWRILLNIPSYPGKTQTKIIVACMALHNFIRISGLDDDDFALLDHYVNYVPPEALIDQPETVEAPSAADVAEMNAFRDYIAQQLYNRS